MKKSVIKTVLVLLLCGMAGFASAGNSGVDPKKGFEDLWKSYAESIEKDLPESAAKTLDEIESKALKENNQTQLLKSWLMRSSVFYRTSENNPQQTYIRYLESKTGQLDAVHNALLHEEIAQEYAVYLNRNKWKISNNLSVEGDLSQVEMKYWDKAVFDECINRHYLEALQPADALKRAKTSDFLLLYDFPGEMVKYVEYEPSLFEFMFHRVANYYKSEASADDMGEGLKDTVTSWWLPAEAFVKADLGHSDKPLFRCLEIYQELLAYNLRNSNLDALIYNDFKRLELVNSILGDDQQYLSALENLKKRHADHPLSAEITALMAYKLVSQHEQNNQNSIYSGNYSKAKAMCEESIAKFPDSQGAKTCRDIVKNIVQPQIGLELKNVQLPGEPVPAVLAYRNTTNLYYRIVKVSENELLKLNECKSKSELLNKLGQMKAVAEQDIHLPAETDYLGHKSMIALPAFGKGLYCLTASPMKGDSLDRTLVCQFQVSSLAFMFEKGESRMTVVTLDRKTGKPVEGVTVECYSNEWVGGWVGGKTRRKIIANLKSDKEGRVVFKNGESLRRGFHINLRKDDDNLLSVEYFYIHDYDDNEPYRLTRFFTDRAIYRPGQTVYYQGIMVRVKGDERSLAANRSSEVLFYDGNYQKIASAKITTDEYGSFSGSFVIPTDRKNGFFRLEEEGGNHIFRVEEYKRPTFEVNFEKPKEKYKLNDNVTIHGDVKAYAGFGLDSVSYSYRVVRKTTFPWRCWWWNYPVVEDEQIAYGEAGTDGLGRFAVTFRLKPSLRIAPEKLPLFTYEIEVTATSRQGETQTGRYSIRAGYNEIDLSCDLPSEVEKSEMDKYHVMVSNLSGQPARSHILRRIYRYDNPKKISYFGDNVRTDLDRQLLSDKELENLFPSYSFYDMPQKQLVDEARITVEDTALFYGGKALQPGKYLMELRGLDDTLVVISRQFTVFEKNSGKMPFTSLSWVCWGKESASPGEETGISIGSSAKDVEVSVRLWHGDELRLEKRIRLSNEVQHLSYKVTEKDRGVLTWQYAFVKDNDFREDKRHVLVLYDNYHADVRLSTLRDKLSPGAEETWEVTVRDISGNPLKAALLAGMYDASLDVFARNSWQFSMTPPYRIRSEYDWGIGRQTFQFTSDRTFGNYISSVSVFDLALPSDFAFSNPYIGSVRTVKVKAQKPIFEMDQMTAVKSKRNAGGKSLQGIEFNDESTSSESLVYVVDGVKSDENGLDVMSPEEPLAHAEPTLRENFNETAFFFPQLRTNADGSATFCFTMPDALTRWKLMLLAYTKERQTGYKEYTFTSSKPVMIMADMPRYIYDNDTIWMVANVINTGDEAVTPKAKLEIFDAATMQPLNLLLSAAEIPMEQILPGRSHEVRWKVAARHDLGLIAFRFTAYAGTFSDAEQRLLPVLCSEVFMTQTLPFTVKANSEQTFNFDAIANPGSNERDHSLTLNFSSNPVWYAVQSLPYLANTKTDNAENAFYVFYANTLSSYIASKIPNLLNYIKKWQIETPEALQSQLEKDQDLKAIMLQETPWVLEAKSESEQRSRLAALFEVNTLRNRQSNALKLISDKQQYSGGWSWRDGMPESPFISTNILAGFGRLQQMGALESLGQDERNRVQNICNKAVRYLEQQVAEEYRKMKKNSDGKDWPIGSLTLNELYALSFFAEQNSDKDFATAKKYWLGSLDKEWTSFNFNQRAKAAFVLQRSGNAKAAQLIIKSFKECAQKNEQIGMYWPKKYFSFESHIATHANIMAAFAEISPDNETMDRLRVWLLTQKQTNRWENSASTADALYALLMRGTDWFEEGREVTLRFGNTPVSTEGGEAGTGFIQRRWNANEVTPEMRRLTVNNPTDHLVWGGLFRQYFVPIDEVKGDESGFTIKRELFVEKVTEQGKVLVPIGGTLRQAQGAGAVPEPVEGTASLKVGDKVTVKITFENKQDMSYVFVKDLRAAGFEPLEQVSRYRSNDRMWYYQTNTDTDMEFFIEHLSKGIHQLEYSMFVTKEGVLNNGYALIQCQYVPEFTACSNGMKVKVERNEP
ncbi:MAG: hypothetical protein IKO59_09615 [Bacteroidales bacterium]|nr:hypothetical protein [Bacteroidales bacterium]